MLYVVLTGTAIWFGTRVLEWFRSTAFTATAVALGMLVEGGVAYEAVSRAVR